MGRLRERLAKLHVHVHEAKGLKGGGLLRSISPYCIVQVGTSRLKTTVIKGGHNHPYKFDHCFVFRLRGDEDVMTLTLIDKDSASPETILGEGEISLTDLDSNGKYHGEIPLKRKNGKPGGIVKVTMRLRHASRLKKHPTYRSQSRRAASRGAGRSRSTRRKRDDRSDRASENLADALSGSDLNESESDSDGSGSGFSKSDYYTSGNESEGGNGGGNSSRRRTASHRGREREGGRDTSRHRSRSRVRDLGLDGLLPDTQAASGRSGDFERKRERERERERERDRDRSCRDKSVRSSSRKNRSVKHCHKEHREPRDCRDHREHREYREYRDHRDDKDCRDYREHRERKHRDRSCRSKSRVLTLPQNMVPIVSANSLPCNPLPCNVSVPCNALPVSVVGRSAFSPAYETAYETAFESAGLATIDAPPSPPNRGSRRAHRAFAQRAVEGLESRLARSGSGASFVVAGSLPNRHRSRSATTCGDREQGRRQRSVSLGAASADRQRTLIASPAYAPGDVNYTNDVVYGVAPLRVHSHRPSRQCQRLRLVARPENQLTPRQLASGQPQQQTVVPYL